MEIFGVWKFLFRSRKWRVTSYDWMLERPKIIRHNICLTWIGVFLDFIAIQAVFV